MPEPTPVSGRLTLRHLRRMALAGEAFAMLTCYDATMARWLWRGGVRGFLVGDTAAQVVLGHDTTLPVEMDLLVALTAAVRRAVPDAFVMADMPFGSYQADTAEAIRNACRFVKEAHADAVKLEVSGAYVGLVEKLSAAGVPVVAHLGSLPQHVRATGGFRAAGKEPAEAARILAEAQRMIDAGAAMLLLEAVPGSLAKKVVEIAHRDRDSGAVVPVISCGAGPDCDGQVVVTHDLLGLTDWQPPFAKPLAQVGQGVAEAAARWCERVIGRV